VKRFYILEHEGYPSMAVGSTGMIALEVMVLDRDQNHDVVRSWLKPQGANRTGRHARMRAEAETLCAEMNAWHDAQMSLPA